MRLARIMPDQNYRRSIAQRLTIDLYNSLDFAQSCRHVSEILLTYQPTRSRILRGCLGEFELGLASVTTIVPFVKRVVVSNRRHKKARRRRYSKVYMIAGSAQLNASDFIERICALLAGRFRSVLPRTSAAADIRANTRCSRRWSTLKGHEDHLASWSRAEFASRS